MRIPTIAETVHVLEQWVRHELPFINRMIEGDGHTERLTAGFGHIASIAGVWRDVHDAAVARRLLQLLGFVVSSLERHVQANGGKPGAGVESLGLTPTLIHLAHVAAHAPRDSHYTYWIDNQGVSPLTFTGALHETAYIRVLHHTHHLHSVAAAALHPITLHHCEVTSHEAHEALRAALHAEERLAEVYRSFAAHDDPAFFHVHLASYLASYPVGDVMTDGPDPFNLAAPIELHLILGDHEHYPHHEWRHRLPHLHQHDRERLESAAQHPSVASRIHEAAGLHHHHDAAMHHDTVIAFERLAAAVRGNAAHFEAIHSAMHLAPHEHHLLAV